MGRAFYDQFEEAKALYRKANTCLGFDLTALCFEGPPEELTKTEKCQPALFVTSLAAFAALCSVSRSAAPVGIAGLSLGELTALAVAEALRFEDGVYLVQARGEAMAECAAHHQGAMLAVIGLLQEAIEDICTETGVVAANYNAADQVVLSGQAMAIQRAEVLAKEKGAKRAMRLEVAGAFHSPLMQPAADTLKRALEKVDVQTPKYPVISNVTAQPLEDPATIKATLVRQIVSPVRWEASMRYLRQAGAATFLEFPPARVLTGLLRRIDKQATGIPLESPSDFDKLPATT